MEGEEINAVPALDKFVGLKLLDPVTVAIQWVSAPTTSRISSRQELHARLQAAHHLYEALQQLFHDLGPDWPQAEPGSDG